MKNLNPTIKKTDIIFPPESGLIIRELLEKYDLKKQEQEEISKFLNPTIPPELKKDIFEKLPGTKISRLVRNYAEGKVSLKDLFLLLERNLNIPKEKAKNLVNELESKILIFIKPVSAEKKAAPPSEVPAEIKRPTPPTKKSKPDIYRESIK